MSFITNPALLPKVRSKALMDFANGQPCSLRLPGVCCHDPATSVHGHLPGIGKSNRSKVSDIHGAIVCWRCHQVIDTFSHGKFGLTDAMVLDAMLRGHAETQARWIGEGLLVVPDGEII